ncbi:MAG: mannose-6-phosphate isomerase [Alphaproteobacteria bacterium]|nr:mannose-6-phosphate isomerase [Alphaproteobacteria bacterium]
MTALDALFADVRRWMFDLALPLWSKAAVDPAHGGFFEALDMTAAPVETSFRRPRVTSRQVYVFSHAAMLGWTAGDAVARRGVEFLLRGENDGAWPQRLTPAGAPNDAVFDLYDHAFLLSAFAWRWRAAQDHEALQAAHRVVDFIERAMLPTASMDPRGFLHTKPPQGPRLQNPHMHLLEAGLAAYEATGEPRFAALSHRLVDLFLECLFDGRTLGERFDDAWGRAAGEAGRTVEPGHHFEWAWILCSYQRLMGRNVTAQALALVDFAETFGVDRETQATCQSVRDDGAVVDASSRTWPNTERIKGSLAAFELAGRDPRPAVLGSARLLLDKYLATPTPGLWIDHFDAAGAPLSNVSPTSTHYHVFLAFAELLRFGPRLRALG